MLLLVLLLVWYCYSEHPWTALGWLDSKQYTNNDSVIVFTHPILLPREFHKFEKRQLMFTILFCTSLYSTLNDLRSPKYKRSDILDHLTRTFGEDLYLWNYYCPLFEVWWELKFIQSLSNNFMVFRNDNQTLIKLTRVSHRHKNIIKIERSYRMVICVCVCNSSTFSFMKYRFLHYM